MGKLAPDLEEGREFDRCGLADGAPEERALGGRIETIAVLQDVRNETPGTRASEGGLPRLGVELMQELRPELDEENYLGRDSVDRSPAAPVHRIDADLQMNEARCERCRHAVGNAAIGFRGCHRRSAMRPRAIRTRRIYGRAPTDKGRLGPRAGRRAALPG